jgi:acyl-CoA dehydrogenase
MLDFQLSEEQQALVEATRRFTKERIIPAAAAADRDATFPKAIFEEAWQLGIINTTIPSEYGGAGMGELDNAVMCEELAYGCTGIQTSMLANTLAGTPIILAGSEEQKKKYLGMLTASPVYASYCTTEPTGGSDVAGMRTRFEEKGDSFILNGEKCWITNASLASFYVVFATVNPELGYKGIAAFIVDRDSEGLKVGKHEDKMGQRASDTAAVHFEDVKVPKANLLAPAGQGFKLAMRTFNQTRPDIGAMATGLMQRCLDESLAYARERKAFGVAIGEHQMIQHILADMAIHTEATRLMYQKAAWKLDRGEVDATASAFAKAFGADHAMQTAVDAVQVFGGNGYVKDYPVEKLMRDAKVLQIYEGTSQIQRMVIAKSLLKQG